MSNYISLGKYLKYLRINNGLTLTELSFKLNIATATISRIETGNRLATDDQLKIYSKFFNINPHELQVEALTDKVFALVKYSRNFKDIFAIAALKITYNNIITDKMNQKNNMSTKEGYFIRQSGKNNSKLFYIIHYPSFDTLDMFFQTIEDAKEYASKNNLQLMDYSNQNDNQ